MLAKVRMPTSCVLSGGGPELRRGPRRAGPQTICLVPPRSRIAGQEAASTNWKRLRPEFTGMLKRHFRMMRDGGGCTYDWLLVCLTRHCCIAAVLRAKRSFLGQGALHKYVQDTHTHCVLFCFREQIGRQTLARARLVSTSTAEHQSA